MNLRNGILGVTLTGLVLSSVALADFGPQVGTGRLIGKVYKMTIDGTRPVAGALVEVFDQNGDLADRTLTDSDGAFYFSGLASGSYKVQAQSPGEGRGRVTAEVRSGYTTSVRLMLRLR